MHDRSNIRACAAQVLENLSTGSTEKLDYNKVTIARAYKLLIFEGLLKRKFGWEISEQGKRHIAESGYEVYPRKIDR